MGKKHCFSKIVAAICVLTLCVTMVLPRPFSRVEAAEPSSVESITLKKVEGIVYYDTEYEIPFFKEEGVDFAWFSDGETEYIDETGIKYTKKDDSIEITADGDILQSLPSKVVIRVGAEAQPTIDKSQLAGAFATYKEVSENLWDLTFVLARATSSFTVTPTAGTPKYTVTFSGAFVTSDYTVADLAKTQQVANDPGITFHVKDKTEGRKSITVLANGVVIEPTEGQEIENTYTCKPTKDTVIEVVTAVNTCEVKEPEEKSTTAYTYTRSSASTTVEYGGSFAFYVTPKAGFADPVVNVNDIPFFPVTTNYYVISNITDIQTITITSGEAVTPTITFLGGTGYSFEGVDSSDIEGGSATVGYGKDFSFKVNLETGYDKAAVVVSVNGIPLAASGDKVYTIKNVTTDMTVSVSGVQQNTYTVTLTDGEGYTFSTTDSKIVTHNGMFTFSITLLAGYKAGVGFDVKATVGAVSKIPGSDGVYRITVTGIASDTEITVVGVESIQSTVQFTMTGEGATVTEESGSSLEGNKKDNVPYNGTVRFRVCVARFYELVTVAVNGTPISPVNGVYTINNITGDTSVEIVTQEVKLTVHFDGGDYGESSDVETTITTVRGGSVSFPRLNSSDVLYTYKWDKEGAVVTAEMFASSYEITITAEWSLDVDKLEKVFKFKPDTAKWEDPNDLHFRVQIELYDQLATAFDKIRVTGIGTIYSRADEALEPEKIKQAVLARNSGSLEQKGSFLRQKVSDYEYTYNYFNNVVYTFEELRSKNDPFFELILTDSKGRACKGMGWLELEITASNGKTEKVVICTEVMVLDGKAQS